MLIVFKSQASGDVMMFQKNARELLRIIGKDIEAAMGVITVEQLPQAIARLKAAIEEDRRALAERDSSEPEVVDATTGQPVVHLAQRAHPLLELLQYALEDEKPVTWGV